MTGLTARAVLSPTPGIPGPVWRRAHDRLQGPLRAVSTAGRHAVDRHLAAAIDRMFDVDLGDTLVGGWRTHRDLLTAARTTRADASRAERVVLADHDISATHHPYLEIVINGVSLARLEWDLGIRLEVEGVVAVVRGGRLVELLGGGIGAAVTLGCEGYELAARRLVGLEPRAS